MVVDIGILLIADGTEQRVLCISPSRNCLSGTLWSICFFFAWCLSSTSSAMANVFALSADCHLALWLLLFSFFYWAWKWTLKTGLTTGLSENASHSQSSHLFACVLTEVLGPLLELQVPDHVGCVLEDTGFYRQFHISQGDQHTASMWWVLKPTWIVATIRNGTAQSQTWLCWIPSSGISSSKLTSSFPEAESKTRRQAGSVKF